MVYQKNLKNGKVILNIYEHEYFPAVKSKIIGRLKIEDLSTRKIIYIPHLSVDKGFRSKGIGNKLLNHAITLSKYQGCEGVSLYVHIENERAIKFYKSFGFFICQINKNHYLMALNLKK